MNPYVLADNSGNYFSQGFLLEIINSVSDPIFVKDRQHRWIFLNNAFCQLTGYDREQLIGKSDYDFFSTEQADIFWEKDELIFTSGVSNDDRGYFTDAQGKVYIVSTKKSLFNDESGNQFLIGTIKEITTSNNQFAEVIVKATSNLLSISDYNESINATLENLGSAADVEQVSIIAVNNNKITEIELTNQHWKWSKNDVKTEFEIFPRWDKILSQGEIIAGSVNDFPDSEREILQAENIRSILVIPIQIAGNFRGYIRFDSCQKERQWLDSEKSILQAAADCLGGAFYRHQLQEKLIKSKQFLQLVVDSIPQIIVWKDCNSVFLGCNQKLAEVMNLGSVEEIIGKTDYDLSTTKEQSDWYRECDKRVMDSGVAELHIIEAQKRADGKQAWLDTNKIPLRDKEGNVIGVLATIEDITERKQIEETLRESEEKFQKLSANVPGILYKLKMHPDGSMSFPYVSSGSYELLGIEAEKIKAESNLLFSMIHPDDYKSFEKSVAVSTESFEPFYWEGRLIKSSEKIQWVKTASRPEKQLDGLITWHGFLTDITHLKQTEKALQTAYAEMESLVLERTKELIKTNKTLKAEIEERKNTEAKVQKLAANVPGMLYQFQLHPDGSMSFPYVSSGCDEIYGLQPEQIQADANSILSMAHPDDLKGFENSWAISAKTLQPWQHEGRIVLSSGEVKWIKSRSRPERLENGTILWHGFILDITERKQAEKALLLSNAMLQAQQEAAIDGILVVDENQNILSCNQRFVELWQIPQSVIETGDEKQFLASIVEKFTNLGEFINEVENLYNDVEKSIRDEIDLGDGRTFERYCAPVSSLKGEYFGRVWYFRDITERKRAEAKLRQQTQELENALLQLQCTQVQLIQSEKMSSLGQLVAGIAHEINNPVNFIDANLTYTQEYFEDLLELIKLYQNNYPENSEIEEFIQKIEFDYLQEDLPNIIKSMQTGAARIGKIVLSLRTFSRLDEAELKKIDIHESIDSTLMILQNSLETQPHRSAIVVTKEFEDLPLVECYAGKLNQVFLNILNNAIDALEEAIKNKQIPENEYPRIRILTKFIQRDTVQISIIDNGSGIPEDNLSKLFDPFFTTKPVGKGTGLGLSMSYQIIVEQHKGQLNCISTEGEGTEFQIQIPVSCKNKVLK